MNSEAIARIRNLATDKTPKQLSLGAYAFRAIEVIALVIALLSAYLGFWSADVAQKALREQQESAALQFLAGEAGRGAGTVFAMERLFELRGELANISVLCSSDDPVTDYDPHIGEETPARNCTERFPIDGLRLDGGEGKALQNVRLIGADMRDVEFKNLVLVNVDFSSSRFDQTTFDNVYLGSVSFRHSSDLGNLEFTNVTFGSVDFTRADISPAFLGQTEVFEGGFNVSSASICAGFLDERCVASLPEQVLENMHFAYGQPPIWHAGAREIRIRQDCSHWLTRRKLADVLSTKSASGTMHTDMATSEQCWDGKVDVAKASPIGVLESMSGGRSRASNLSSAGGP